MRPPQDADRDRFLKSRRNLRSVGNFRDQSTLICRIIAALRRCAAVKAWEKHMRTLIIAALLLMHGAVFAQGANQPALSYSFGCLLYTSDAADE